MEAEFRFVVLKHAFYKLVLVELVLLGMEGV